MAVTKTETEPKSVRALREWWVGQSDEQLTAIYRGLENNPYHLLIPADTDVWLRAAYLDIKNQCLIHISVPGLTVGPVSEQDPVKAMTEALECTIRDIYKMLDDVPGGRVSC